jgi:hypothetical protein
VNLPKHLLDEVERRAAGRCEYCRMHQALQGATFHVEHVLPLCRAGRTRLENLAWACPGCNLRKSDRVDALDPDTGRRAALFNPRVQRWSEHFRWDGHRVVALTPTGRATVATLELNHPRRMLIRQAEELFALFPPDDA